jgi:hypothetical protein
MYSSDTVNGTGCFKNNCHMWKLHHVQPSYVMVASAVIADICRSLWCTFLMDLNARLKIAKSATRATDELKTNAGVYESYHDRLGKHQTRSTISINPTKMHPTEYTQTTRTGGTFPPGGRSLLNGERRSLSTMITAVYEKREPVKRNHA